MTKVPYTQFPEQFVREEEDLLQAVQSVMASGNFILGRAVETFESEFAKLCGVSHAIGVGSGTDALILSLKALGIGPGDEVITAPNSWISTASSIALLGARPVFVDVGNDLNLDPNRISDAITPKTKAILPVHLTGRVANMQAIQDIADQHGLFVVEDAAQAINARYQNTKAGAFGDLGCFSLHPLKNLNACGDAGIITCNDDVRAHQLRLLRNHGLVDRDHAQFWGYCSRLDALQAAILQTRLKHLPEIENKRRETAAFYTKHLKSIVGVPETSESEYHVYHTYIIQTEHRDKLETYLKAQNISVKIHYPTPIHLQQAAQELGYKAGDFPNTERLSKQILTLPIHHYLTQEQKEHVVSSIQSFYKKLV